MDDLQSMARLLDALRPWHGQLVIVGGWAHQLHRLHPLASPPSHAVIRTGDADLALSASLPFAADIASALKAADFKEELSSDHTPPVSNYFLGDSSSGFYAEFLVPLFGSGYKRNGEPDATVVKAGVTAQKLRHLDILLLRPWGIALDGKNGPPVNQPMQVMAANPVTFIVQKLLIQKYRKPAKKAQDALYIHDTVELFSASFDKLSSVWNEQIKPSLPGHLLKDFDQLRKEQFGSVTDVIRAAVRIPQDRTLSPDALQAASAYGLEEIFS